MTWRGRAINTFVAVVVAVGSYYLSRSGAWTVVLAAVSLGLGWLGAAYFRGCEQIAD